MRLNCGLTNDEEQDLIKRGVHPNQHWHEAFALFPKRVGFKDCRWLETIERRGKWGKLTYTEFGWSYGWKWEYRAAIKS